MLLKDKDENVASFQVNQEKLLSTLEQEITELNSSSSVRDQRLDHMERTVDRIDKNVKIYIDRKVKEINMLINSVKSSYDSETVTGQIKENVKEILNNSIPGADLRHLRLIFIIYICLKQNYIKQYKSLQTNTLFSGYCVLKLTGFAKKGAMQDF